ncbi:hypothetical protein SCLCIDRAFT_255019 [Scleroderma citrinum Foug A]|uniref:Uncharacterized protein n=1 Tax=Scleroderma citrinum Foug A TaxID=1036808 RepID=A0A0C2ZZF4_9AGAM|nr:hypothetical protein SCLCIDRAFT_255019 [Scleroderma citrinum Foug A]
MSRVKLLAYIVGCVSGLSDVHTLRPPSLCPLGRFGPVIPLYFATLSVLGRAQTAF